MSSRKRNEWLDTGDSDDGGEIAFDSETVEDSRAQRAFKRRRISTNDLSDNSSDAEEQAQNEKGDIQNIISNSPARVLDASSIAIRDENKTLKAVNATPVRSKTAKVLIHQPKSSATGIIYLSRVPPFMKPHTVKHLLESYGDIGRVFLTPEDPMSHSRRVRSGGNKKRSFTDGWVEFKNKMDAKLVAETLNAQIIGGKKGGWYHDDIWNIKYLTGFKWHHLTEQIANENAERAARLRTEIAQTTKENKRFVDNVERAKMLEKMLAKKRRTVDGLGVGGNDVAGGREHGTEDQDGRSPEDNRVDRMHFRQSEVRSNIGKSNGTAEQPEEVRRVLAKIF